MRASLRRLVGAFLIAALLIGSVAVEGVHAGEAGLVVQFGDGTVAYVLIVFPEDEIASIDLLQRSGLSLTSVSYGGLGEAICSIEREGCSLADCSSSLCQTGDPNSPFWKFFRVNANGDSWLSQPFGASGTKVRGGEVDLWSWTGGEADLPLIEMSDMIKLTGAPAERGSDSVYTAWFDANGNAIDPPTVSETQDNPLLVGVVLVLLIGAIGFLMIRRQRALTGGRSRT